MTARAHPLDVKRANVAGRHLFAANDSHADDAEKDDEQQLAPLCRTCYGSGHNCPACVDDDNEAFE